MSKVKAEASGRVSSNFEGSIEVCMCGTEPTHVSLLPSIRGNINAVQIYLTMEYSGSDSSEKCLTVVLQPLMFSEHMQ